MVAKIRQSMAKDICFWKTATGGILLAGLLIPLCIFSYKAYAWAVLADKDLAGVVLVVEEHRDAFVVQSDSIKAVSSRSIDNSEGIELLKMQLQEDRNQTEILEALFFEQTGHEWEEGE